jgi:NAD(P)H-flavin reductase
MSPALAPAPFRVQSTRRETEDTWTLDLVAEGGEPLRFDPGQFTMLYAFGVGEVPISVSGDPARPQRLVHTVRAVGAVSRAVCSTAAGERLGVRGPFGRSWPSPPAGADVVFVAGGLGLAPLRPAVYAALGNRQRHGRVIVLYGGRAPQQLLYRAELDRWRERDDLELAVTVDAAEAGWRGRVGVVPALLERAQLDPERSFVLVCGPEVMMRFSVDAAVALGIDAGRVFVSLERNMRCAVGHCGHCQLGGSFVCRDGPVFAWPEIAPQLRVAER